MKLWTPEECERPKPQAKRRPRVKIPRCGCGCGKAAYWPQSGEPVFHTRLCGYLMALKMVRKRKRV